MGNRRGRREGEDRRGRTGGGGQEGEQEGEDRRGRIGGSRKT